MPIVLLRRIALALVAVLCASSAFARAAESTTGTIVGLVRTNAGASLRGITVVATSASGRYAAQTGAEGRYALLGVAPDTYAVTIDEPDFEPVSRAGITVVPGAHVEVDVTLVPRLRTIADVHSSASAFSIASTSDQYAVNGARARASYPIASSAGLGSYVTDSVQGAVAQVPGVEQDAFANAIVRGGTVDDAAFEYDSVPVPQGLVAEPGGNIVGAQLPTTGIATTLVTLAGFSSQAENALGGIIDEIPSTGLYPARLTFEAGTGFGAQDNRYALQWLSATPDRRLRYAFAAVTSNEYLSYGDGRTFYPAEAGTYGLALRSRAIDSLAGNVHYAATAHDDVSIDVLDGQAVYAQYGTPFAGETQDGAPVDYATGLRGSYDVIKGAWLHTSHHATLRAQLYQSRYGSSAGGPFWDDLSFPDGIISLFATQGAREDGVTVDVDDAASARHEIRYGADERINWSFLDQVIPTAAETITSRPTIASSLVYLGDTWSIGERTQLSGTLRSTADRVAPSDGPAYTITAIDPHLSSSYRIDRAYALRATFDHTTVAPKPLEADRSDSANPAPFVPLGPETADEETLSVEGGTRIRTRMTYFAIDERNRIDVLPFNFRSAVASSESPSGIGVPTNAGDLRAHGLSFSATDAALTFSANLTRAFSSSASQFAYNDLNAAAVAAGHLFPVSYIPDFTAALSYEFSFPRARLRVTPSLSYESGYPYGNGTMVWIFDPVTGKPEHVPNDNHVNPGYNYYFLKDPALPFNAQSNPYIGSLGTPEGADPNTLRTTPQLLASVHVEQDISPRLTAIVDVFNLFDVTSPTQMQGNPYLIGPPGYTGGNAAYASYYGSYAGFAAPYELGNGVPTNDGVTQAVPWRYGTSGYVPMSYPLGRTAQVTLRLRV